MRHETDPMDPLYGCPAETVQLRHGFAAVYVIDRDAVADARTWGISIKQRKPRKPARSSRPPRRQSGGAA